MATGRPSIPLDRQGNVRQLQVAIDAIRQRLAALDGQVQLLLSLNGQNANGQAIARLNQQLQEVQTLVSALPSTSEVTALAALFDQEDGIVVLRGGSLVTRRIDTGPGLLILNPAGVDGNPLIYLDGLLPALAAPAGAEGVFFAEAAAEDSMAGMLP